MRARKSVRSSGKGSASRVGLKPENGVEVIATGKITSYPERSEYQLIVERLEYAGAGALLARIEALRVKLQAEGLFERKRALPMLPRVIGVVTSAQGAVLQDIKTTIARRFPRPILLWPVAVQGEAAAAQIAAAINGFSALPVDGPIPRPDVLIVARGGGSLEDLMAFNDEAVLRAAAACSIPLISAVGHETDTTLIDFVSDRRAPTPTAAAEMAIPARLELLADLAQKTARLTGAIARASSQARLLLDRAGAKLPDLPGMLGAARQRLDDRGERLALALPNYTITQHRQLDGLANRLRHPREILAAHRNTISLLDHRLIAALPHLLRAGPKTPGCGFVPADASGCRNYGAGATRWVCWRNGWIPPCPAASARSAATRGEFRGAAGGGFLRRRAGAGLRAGHQRERRAGGECDTGFPRGGADDQVRGW